MPMVSSNIQRNAHLKPCRGYSNISCHIVSKKFIFSDNRVDNHALMIVSIECNNRDIQQDDIVVHRVPAINSGENKSILDEFQRK